MDLMDMGYTCFVSEGWLCWVSLVCMSIMC